MRNLALSVLTILALAIVPSCTEASAGSALEVIKGHLSKMSTAVENVKDEATAKTANDTISGLVDKVKTALTGAKALPGEGMKKITDAISSGKTDIIAQITKLGPTLQPLLKGALEKLKTLGS